MTNETLAQPPTAHIAKAAAAPVSIPTDRLNTLELEKLLARTYSAEPTAANPAPASTSLGQAADPIRSRA